MRADRLLSIVLLLQGHGRLTGRALAERLEVSERTIHRDMTALSTAGVPVMATRGGGGGWSLLGGYRTDATGLSAAEAQALVLAPPARLLADLGLRHVSESALLKLLAALPSLARRDADEVRQRIHIDAAGWRPAEGAPACLTTLQEAVWRERRLALTYRRRDDAVVERVVDPLGLVAKGSAWYLVATVGGEVRSYRASRVLAATPTGEPATRPAEFDLAAYWEAAAASLVANLPRYEARVRVDPAILPRLLSGARYARVERVGDLDTDGWLPVALCCDTADEACAYALGFGDRLEVLDPPELRAAVIRRAGEVVAFYAAAGSAGDGEYAP